MKTKLFSILLLTALILPACHKDNGHKSKVDPDPTPAGGLFSTFLQKTDEEIERKLDELWNHYFKGDANSKVYYDNGSSAYILDVYENQVSSQGMGFGMMICVQTGHKSEFDKLWAFAKNNMWRKSGEWDGYFCSLCNTSGNSINSTPCPGAEMYITASLLLAAKRWDDDAYMQDAQYILKKMWEGTHKLFNTQHNIITYVPTGNEMNFTSPSYDLPAFIKLFEMWSDTNNDKWGQALSATRTHLYKSSNSKSGLFSDLNNFDGTPHGVIYYTNGEKYMYTAMQCAMNIGMDYYLFRADDERQTTLAKRIIDFFEKDNYTHARFNWDGSNPSEVYTSGEKGCNAVICYALADLPQYKDAVKKNLEMAWNEKPVTGQYRYPEGIVHYLAMLHLCGSFRIWE